jgi:hypothetical protein
MPPFPDLFSRRKPERRVIIPDSNSTAASVTSHEASVQFYPTPKSNFFLSPRFGLALC